MAKAADVTSPGSAAVFDFDRWSRLAKDKPEAFEAMRAALIRDAIERSADRRAMSRLQFRIDGVRRKSRTPYQACLKLSEMMWHSFLELNDRLREIASSDPARHALPSAGQEDAEIIELAAAKQQRRPRS